MDALARANAKNPAVKRLLQEYKELSAEQSRDFVCEPLEDNIFEWHFVVRGPRDTEFEGGLFHGRIVLPPEYPFKPPTFAFLTPNGRFEVNTKICLSISTHHPEHWQPSWSLRTALTALAAFFPTKGDGAIGALDYTPQERRTLAAASRGAAPCGGQSEARAAVTRALHERMLAAEALPPSPPPAPPAPYEPAAGASQEAQEAPSDAPAPEPAPSPAAEEQAPPTPPPPPPPAASEGAAGDDASAAASPQTGHAPCEGGCGASCSAALEAAARDMAAPTAAVRHASPPPPVTPPPPRTPRTPPPAAAPRSQAELEAEERRLVRAALAIAAAIAAILIRRAMLWATAVAM